MTIEDLNGRSLLADSLAVKRNETGSLPARLFQTGDCPFSLEKLRCPIGRETGRVPYCPVGALVPGFSPFYVILRIPAQVQWLIMPFWMAHSAMRMESARLSGLPVMPEMRSHSSQS